MIITEFYDGQGLGNQLWVYVVTRAIAYKLQMPYLILSPEKFKGESFLDIDFGEIDRMNEILEKLSQKEIAFFKEIMYYDIELDCFNIDYDSRVLELRPYTKIDGYFQSEKYFFDHIIKLNEILPIKQTWLQKQFLDDTTCVLNIRGGEYIGNSSLILPKEYWENAMKNIIKFFPNIKEFVIVTDDQEYSSKLFPSLKQVERGIAQSYLALHQAKYLILSNSSFSYFPIKTKEIKPFVIAPMYWARFNNINKRWASPANLYLDWMWQDANGYLFSYEECLDSYNKTMEHYKTNYTIYTTSKIVEKFKDPLFFRKYIPQPLKNILKVIFCKLKLR